MPWCYTLYRGDAGCDECEHRGACQKATADNGNRLTIRQAADAAIAKWKASRGEAAPDVIELMQIAAQFSGVAPAVLRYWETQHEWHRTFRLVSVVCQRAGGDARTYVRAIAETVGAHAVNNKWALKHGMFVGESACARFQRWVERNRLKHNDERADRCSDPERERLLAGECCFADRLLMSRAVTLEDAEAYARAAFPGWELEKTAGRDDLRLTALAGALASIEAGLPHRVLAPSGPWTWQHVRDSLMDLTRLPEEEDDEEQPHFSPELGEVM